MLKLIWTLLVNAPQVRNVPSEVSRETCFILTTADYWTNHKEVVAFTLIKNFYNCDQKDEKYAMACNLEHKGLI